MFFPIWFLLPIAYSLSVPNEQYFALDDRPILKPNLMDKLYGDLVNTPETEQFRINALKSGEKVQDDETFHSSAVEDFYKILSQIEFPDKDNTDDINSPQNMFGGILTFGHIPHFNCFDPKNSDKAIDIAIVGAPFDTGVSYRPGARFGPEALRSGARRIGEGTTERTKKKHGYPKNPWDVNTHNLSIIDCGDVNMNPFDNRIALNQLYRGERAIHKHNAKSGTPKILTMGGDHTITLMALKSLHEQLGKPVHIIHFDSHIDTWDPKILGGGLTDYMELNHGTFLHFAAELGYILPKNNYHVGLRAPLMDVLYDDKHDRECGFKSIVARDIDRIGVHGIINKLKEAIGDEPVYISVDIDVLDPAFAPGTGTMEAGGFSTRELLTILDGLRSLHLVGADLVEVSPPYDTNSEITGLAGIFVIESLIKTMMED